MKMRGQAGLELLFFTVMILLLLSLSFVFSANTSSDSINLRRKFEASNVCQHFSTLISSVAAAGNGTVVEYILPPDVAGVDYNVTINGPSTSVSISYSTGLHGCPVATGNFTSIVLANKTGIIRNTGEGVSIE